MVVQIAAAAAGRTALGRTAAGEAGANGAAARDLKTLRPVMNSVPGIGRKPRTIPKEGDPAPQTPVNNNENRVVARHLGRGKVETKTAANNNEPRINTVTAAFMIGGAVAMDLVQFLLLITIVGTLLNSMLTFIAFISYFIWFYLHGVSIFGGRKAWLKVAAATGGTLGELIPVLNAFPLMTPSIVAVIMLSRMEDREGRK